MNKLAKKPFVIYIFNIRNNLKKGIDKMKTAYDLFKKLLEVMADIDRNLDKKSKVRKPEILEALDKKIDALELEMYELRNKLKNIKIE